MSTTIESIGVGATELGEERVEDAAAAVRAIDADPLGEEDETDLQAEHRTLT